MKALLRKSEKECDKCRLLFKTSFMKPLVAQFRLEPPFTSFVSFFAVAARLINIMAQWKLIVLTNLWVALYAVPLNVKRVCFVSKLEKLHFTNIIFILSSLNFMNFKCS